MERPEAVEKKIYNGFERASFMDRRVAEEHIIIHELLVGGGGGNMKGNTFQKLGVDSVMN